MFTIVFRPAALDKIDADMVTVNIPGIPDRAEDQNPTAYYFGKIRQVRTRGGSGLGLRLGLGLGLADLVRRFAPGLLPVRSSGRPMSTPTRCCSACRSS